MRLKREMLIQCGGLLLLAAPFLILGWYGVASARGGVAMTGQLVLGMASLLAAAVFVGKAVALIFSHPSGRLYYKGELASRPASPAIYDVAEIKRRQGATLEAMSEYERIARHYPQELKPYAEMIRMAAVDLKDRDRAMAVFRMGISTLQSEQDRRELRAVHRAVMTGLPVPR